MSWGRISHPSEMLKVGEEISVMIIEVDTERERVSLGLKQTTSNPWENIERKYPVGAHVRGKVRNLTTYGAFVELEEGIDGMVHVYDMSWTRKINPRKCSKRATKWTPSSCSSIPKTSAFRSA